MSQEIITSMSIDEATECLEAITQTAHVAFVSSESMLAQVETFDEGNGWQVLGFESLMDCLAKTLPNGHSQLYKKLAASRTAKRLSTSGIDSNGASTNALARLAKTPVDDQPKVFKEAAQNAKASVTEGDIQRAQRKVGFAGGGNQRGQSYSKQAQASGKTRFAKSKHDCPYCRC